MFDRIIKQCWPALLVFLLLFFLTGIVYPVGITLIGNLFFNNKAQGSLIVMQGRSIGSKLVGQYFYGDKYFWGRPSATPEYPYNAAFAGGSNLGPTNTELKKQVLTRVEFFRHSSWFTENKVPVDLVTTSASGIDPHISPRAADVQIHRVAVARGLSDSKVRTLMLNHIEKRQWFFLGEPRINVLLLNLDLDNL